MFRRATLGSIPAAYLRHSMMGMHEGRVFYFHHSPLIVGEERLALPSCSVRGLSPDIVARTLTGRDLPRSYYQHPSCIPTIISTFDDGDVGRVGVAPTRLSQEIYSLPSPSTRLPAPTPHHHFDDGHMPGKVECI